MKTTDSLHIRGVGWLNASAWGGGLCGEGESGPASWDGLWKRNEIFSNPVKNTGRFDVATRQTLVAVALALRDASRCGNASRGRGTALVGVSHAGSTASNLAYFNDYLGAGRILARGNLFIYTLPSSPLAETAIHFGFEGAMVYAGFTGNETASLLLTARTLLVDGAPDVMAIRVTGEEAIAFWMSHTDVASGLNLSLDEIMARNGSDEPAETVALRLHQLMKGNGNLCA